MQSEIMFCLRSPEREYSPRHLADILERAEQQGYPVTAGSYLAHVTCSQIERLVEGRYDA